MSVFNIAAYKYFGKRDYVSLTENSQKIIEHCTQLINEKIIDRNSENTECKLCYEHSNYLCTICGYPICNKCMEHLKTSTGKCPCCQTYPLSLNNISEEVNT